MSDLTAAITADLEQVERRYGKSKLSTALISRGFHALLFYRLAHHLRAERVPLLPLLLTRIIQIVYGIDIDPGAQLAGGICIVHGTGLVIGAGAVIESGCLLYHGVTLGIKGSSKEDGFPTISRDCVLGTGCTLLGPIVVGEGSVIGANVLLSESVEAGSLVKCPPPIITRRRSNARAGDPASHPGGEGATEAPPAR